MSQPFFYSLSPMRLIELISAEAAGERIRIVTAASLAGIANVLVLGYVNRVAQSADGAGLGSFSMFCLTVFLYVLSARYTCNRTTQIVESALQRIKIRVCDKVERAELEQLERIGIAEISDRIMENMSVISESASRVANLLKSVCILIFAMIYLTRTSLPAFLMITMILGVGFSIYVSKQRQIKQYLSQAAQERLTFFDILMDLLHGFKEVKFSRRRGRQIGRDIEQSASSLRQATIEANQLFNDNAIFATSLFYSVLGAIVYVLPKHLTVDSATLSSLVVAIMFIWGPIVNITGGYPAYVRSAVALDQIDALEAKLDDAVHQAVDASLVEDPWQGGITRIEAQELGYEYPLEGGKGAFRIGPINLAIAPGEVLFIVGGNGSGKSTLVKVLTGLYPCSEGVLRINGTPVDSKNVAAYREMISAIYADFHLFAKLYGFLDDAAADSVLDAGKTAAGISAAQVQRLLAKMQLQGKTAFENGRFISRSLSTGQKKRLAMIVALLEDRPIYVFDEWAADQDPEFRKYFYEELIPTLKRNGKTLIIVSHDDRYFSCGDRVVTMEYGKIRSIAPGKLPGVLPGKA